jgi:hypothetical protein
MRLNELVRHGAGNDHVTTIHATAPHFRDLVYLVTALLKPLVNVFFFVAGPFLDSASELVHIALDL